MSGYITILNHEKILDHIVYEKSQRRNPKIVDSKQLGIKLDEIKKNIPKADYPWRQAALHFTRSCSQQKELRDTGEHLALENHWNLCKMRSYTAFVGIADFEKI